MPWQSTSIAGSMGGITAKANAAISQVQGGLNKLNKHVGELQGKMDQAVSAISSSKDTLGKLAESGFYMITLPPQQGSWSSRLTSAPNAPPNLGYCCGVATIAVAPDLQAVADAYQKTLEAIKKPMADASNIVNGFDFSEFVGQDEPEDLAEIDEEEAKDWSDIFTTDEWKDAALKDVFGGYAEGITKATNKASKAAKSVLANINQASKSASAISKGLSATKNLMSQLESATIGVYTIVLAPANGNPLQRLQAEAGAPPASSEYYTSGYVCVTVAPSLDGLAKKFNTLSKIVQG